MNNINDIELINNYIVITYEDKLQKYLPLNQNTKEEIIKELKENKYNLLNKKISLKRTKKILIVRTIIKILFTTLIYFLTNNLLTNIIVTLWCLEICLFYAISLKQNYDLDKRITKLLTILNTNKLPNEDKLKIINILNYQDFKEPTILNETGKILTFKGKDEK